MFSASELFEAGRLLERCRRQGIMIATAESCTGGLIAALLTEVPGSSEVVDRGFVTYSNQAKEEMLGVNQRLIKERGAVSAEVAEAMAEGACRYSRAALAMAVTGIAGPGGGTAEKPVGLVYIAVHRTSGLSTVRSFHFSGTRQEVRQASVSAAIALAHVMLA